MPAQAIGQHRFTSPMRQLTCDDIRPMWPGGAEVLCMLAAILAPRAQPWWPIQARRARHQTFVSKHV